MTVVTVGATPAILAACGSDDDTGASRDRGGDRASPAAPDASGTINFLSWEGYDIPVPSMKAWKKEQGIDVIADLHRQPRRDPGQDQGRRRRGRLRPHHLLPGVHAALHPARDPHAARREQAPQPRRAVPVLGLGREELLDQPRRRAHRRAVDVGLDRPHLRLGEDRRDELVDRTCSTPASPARSRWWTTPQGMFALTCKILGSRSGERARRTSCRR